MSRIGKKPIKIPDGITVDISKEKIVAKGPKGELFFETPPFIKIEENNGELSVIPENDDRKTKALWGTTRSIVANIIEGVQNGYSKELQVKGVGYRAEMQGENLMLKVGYSHPVEVKKIDGIDFAVAKDIITVSGIKKDLVGRVAAEIRKVRPPEPYKGKGIRYRNEQVVMKEGKKSVGK